MSEFNKRSNTNSFWSIKQQAGFGDAEETNRRFRYLRGQGQNDLSVAFDLPTQMGYDSDHPMARSEIGRAGVAIDSLRDMEILLEEIPLEQTCTSMKINAPAPILLAMYLALADQRGVPWKDLSGSIQNDILKEFVAGGTYIFPLRESMRVVIDTLTFAWEHLPGWNAITISGYHIREAGSSAAQEIAFALSNGIAYIQAALEKGLKVDDFAPWFSFLFAAHLNIFEEVAKFRAAKRVWGHIMKERFNARNSCSQKLYFHAQTAGSCLTAQQPDLNTVRVAYQALSAVLSGTRSLHISSRDEALALPSEYSALIALRTQQLMRCEIGVKEMADPLKGAHLVEELTERLEDDIKDYLRHLDKMGGAMQAIEKGYMQKEIEKNAYRYQQEIEREEKIVIGVNRFATEEEQPFQSFKIDPAVSERQVQQLEEVRRERDQRKVAETLQELRKVALGQGNLVFPILEAVKAYATIGEICEILKEILGEGWREERGSSF